MGILPSYLQAHHNLAAALTKVGKYKEAIQHYQVVLKLKPDFAEAHYQPGRLFEKLGDRDGDIQ